VFQLITTLFPFGLSHVLTFGSIGGSFFGLSFGFSHLSDVQPPFGQTLHSFSFASYKGGQKSPIATLFFDFGFDLS
jgi:hypothetical protein